jgi:undecaprenyl-diphosphatase
MILFLKAAFLGVIEGLTEFLPVSSTGHLILVGRWIGMNSPTFDIAIQLGAILAVLVVYRSIFLSLRWNDKLVKLMGIAIAPALGLGFLLHHTIKTYFFGPTTVIAALFLGGVIMFLVERFPYHPTTTSIQDIGYLQAFWIGIAQCFSLWPGMSRSGSTIVGGLLVKLDYETAATFSFLISVPVMIAATGYDLLKSYHLLSSHDLGLIGVGFLVSFLVALVAIVSFIKLLVRYRLTPFAVYRVVLAVVLVLCL